MYPQSTSSSPTLTHCDRPSPSPIPQENKDDPLISKPKLLACHDMAGNYLEDRFTQGSHDASAYVFTHWPQIDIFNYFSHHLVSPPPPAWTNAAHRHGVKILGTFITEGEQGRSYCEQLFSNQEQCQLTARQLVRIAEYYGFDGWLVNIENTLDNSSSSSSSSSCSSTQLIDNLIFFLKTLTDMSHTINDHNLIIWYDAVTVQGRLEWQDALTPLNKPFFDACDAIYLNYTWKPDTLERTVELAHKGSGRHASDVFVGVDCFGRGTIGGGGLHCDVALRYITDIGASAALFAVGWPFEDGQGWLKHMNEEKEEEEEKNRQVTWRERDDVFWRRIKAAWYGNDDNADSTITNHPIARRLPLHSTFSNGTGRQFYLQGKKVSSLAWYNIDVQSLQPSLNIHPSDDNSSSSSSSSVKASIIINDKDDEGGGGRRRGRGGYLHISGHLRSKSPVVVDLFPVNIPLNQNMQQLEAYIVATAMPCHVTTVVQLTVAVGVDEKHHHRQQYTVTAPLSHPMKSNNEDSNYYWIIVDNNDSQLSDDNEWHMYVLSIDIPCHMCCPNNRITNIELSFIPRPESSPVEDKQCVFPIDWSVNAFSLLKNETAYNNNYYYCVRGGNVVTNLTSTHVEVTRIAGFGGGGKRGTSMVVQMNALLEWSIRNNNNHDNDEEDDDDILRYHIWYGSMSPDDSQERRGGEQVRGALTWLGCTLSRQYKITGLVLNEERQQKGVVVVVQVENDSSGSVESVETAASIVMKPSIIMTQPTDGGWVVLERE